MSVAKRVLDSSAGWPALPLSSWADTYATLHMWTQIVGKVRLALSPHVNHWWEVPLYVSARGLTTSPIPRSQRPNSDGDKSEARQLKIDTDVKRTHRRALRRVRLTA